VYRAVVPPSAHITLIVHDLSPSLTIIFQQFRVAGPIRTVRGGRHRAEGMRLIAATKLHMRDIFYFLIQLFMRDNPKNAQTDRSQDERSLALAAEASNKALQEHIDQVRQQQGHHQ
jgi:hypothetical protein